MDWDEYRIEWTRHIDGIICQRNRDEQALKCLSTLAEIANNLNQPTLDRDNRFRTIRGRNQKLQQHILSVEGGPEALILMGWKKGVKDFEESWVYPPDADALKARIAHQVIVGYRDKLQERVNGALASRSTREEQGIF